MYPIFFQFFSAQLLHCYWALSTSLFTLRLFKTNNLVFQKNLWLFYYYLTDSFKLSKKTVSFYCSLLCKILEIKVLRLRVSVNDILPNAPWAWDEVLGAIWWCSAPLLSAGGTVCLVIVAAGPEDKKRG